MMLTSALGHTAGYRFHTRSQPRPRQLLRVARVAKQEEAEEAVAVDRQSNSKGSRKAFSQAGPRGAGAEQDADDCHAARAASSRAIYSNDLIA
jgi:hypothetical protein